jgi:hypothetical protein
MERFRKGSEGSPTKPPEGRSGGSRWGWPAGGSGGRHDVLKQGPPTWVMVLAMCRTSAILQPCVSRDRAAGPESAC